MKEIKVESIYNKSIYNIPKNFTGVAVDNAGNKYRYQNGKRHCIDGPAVEWSNGDNEWYQNGKLHRLTGPAANHSYNEEWFQNGKLHRLDGPAQIMYYNERYFINGAIYSKEEFFEKTKLVQQQLPKRHTKFKHLTDDQWYEYLNILVIK